jgi:hypothetical protein
MMTCALAETARSTAAAATDVGEARITIRFIMLCAAHRARFVEFAAFWALAAS